jgi:hypothetical protein
MGRAAPGPGLLSTANGGHGEGIGHDNLHDRAILGWTRRDRVLDHSSKIVTDLISELKPRNWPSGIPGPTAFQGNNSEIFV